MAGLGRDVLVGELAPDHRVDQVLLGDVAGVPRGDLGPVAQADDRVGHLADLVEAVGDVDDPRALVAQHPDPVEHALGLRAAQRRRRLVEDDVARLAGDRLGDLDLLLDGHRQAADQAVRVDVGAEQVEHLARLVVHPPAVVPSARPREPADVDVLGQRLLRLQPDLLVYQHHARGQRVGGGVRVVGRAVDGHRARVRPVDPGDERAQRRLPGAVLPDQTDDRAAGEVEVDALEHRRPREALDQLVADQPAAGGGHGASWEGTSMAVGTGEMGPGGAPLRRPGPTTIRTRPRRSGRRTS